MGNSASKVNGDSPRSEGSEGTSSHPWFSAPCGSWVIRFSPGHPTQEFNEMTEIKGLPLYHWSSPEWITGDIFNNLMFVVVQIFLEGNPNRLIRLIEEPLEAVEMIAQFNTFIDSTNQDVRELRNQFFEAANESIDLHVKDEQLEYLDLLVTNEFDPRFEVRAVISRKSRGSKSSLLRSVSSAIKTKLGRLKKTKGHQASHNNPTQQSFPVPSRHSTVGHTPVRLTAPWLSELNERTETITRKDDLDNTDEVYITAVFDNSNINNSTKDGDRERVKTDSKNAKSMRNLEEENAELELEMPSISFSLISTSETFTPLPTSEQSLDKLITNQKDVCCTKVSQETSTDTYSSLTGVTEIAVLLQPKENSDKEKNAGEGSCAQEDSGELADVHGQVSHNAVIIHTHPAEVGEQHNSNCGPVRVCGDVPSGQKGAESTEHSEDDSPLCGNVPSGPKQAESSEHRKDNGPTCDNVPSGPKQAESSEHRNNNSPTCDNVTSGPNHAESSEHRNNNGPTCDNVPSGPKHAESSEHRNNNGPTCDNVPSGPKQAESSEHRNNNSPTCDVTSGPNHAESSEHRNNNGPTCDNVPSGPKHAESSEHRKDNGPTCDNVPSGPKHAESSEHRNNNVPTCDNVPSGPKHAESSEHRNNNVPTCDNVPSGPNQAKSSEHSLDHGPVCADSPPGTSYAVSNEDKDNDNGQVFNDGPPGESRILAGSSQHLNNDVPVNVMASPEKHPSNPSTIPPRYGLSKMWLRSMTQPVSTDAQERCANVKEEKEQSATPQIHKPSASSFVCLPFHGLSRGCFSPPRQGEPTGVQSRKRKADIKEDDELAAKSSKQDDTFGEAEENRDPSDPKHAESIEHRKDNGPRNSNVPSGPKHAASSEHSQDHGPDSSTKLNEDKVNDNGPVLNDFPSGAILADSTQHHKNDDPINVIAPPEKHHSNPSTFLPIYGLSKSFLRSKTQPVNTVAQEKCANVKEEKEQSAKPQIHKPSSSSFVCLPFHGLSRGSFSHPRQGESTGVQSRKRKADIDESKGDEIVAKRLKQEDMFGEDNRDPCHSSAEGVPSQSDTEMKPKLDNVDDTERDDGSDGSSSESVEWHDALEDTDQ